MAAALFDVFGTLLDVYSVTRRAEELFVGNGERLARLWREKQIEYSRLAHDVRPLRELFAKSRAMRSSIRCRH